MIIGGSRACGKTTELIKKSGETNSRIICSDHRRGKIIYKMAKEMNIRIPHPAPVAELPLRDEIIRDVLVDDLEDVLSKMIGSRVIEASSSFELKDLALNNNQEENVMRTEQLIRKVEELGYNVEREIPDRKKELKRIHITKKDKDNTILITLKVNEPSMVNDYPGFKKLPWEDKVELLNLVHKYLITPIDKRKELARYYHLIPGHFDPKASYVSVRSDGKKVFVGTKNVNDLWIAAPTKEEIKQFSPEIQTFLQACDKKVAE